MDIQTALQQLPSLDTLQDYVAPSVQTLFDVDPTGGGGGLLLGVGIAVGILVGIAYGAVACVGRC